MSDILFLALDSVRRNKLRSFLTVLGVVIGVATVIGMSSIINGLNGNVSAQIEELGSNLIFVSRFPPTMNGRLPPEIINRKRLTLEDADAIAQLPLIKAVAPILRYFAISANSNAFTVRYRDRTAKNTIIEGVTPEQETVMNLQISAGRWINEADDRHSSQVVVLGHDTAETIFPVNVDPVGKEVEIEGNVFRVIGVMEKRKDALLPGNNPNDNSAEMPTKTFWRLHPEQQDFFFVVKPISQQAMARAVFANRGSPAEQAWCCAEQGQRLQHIHAGLLYGSLESDLPRNFHRHAWNFLNRPVGWRCWRDEYHAGFGYRTNARDRHSKGDRSDAPKYPDAVSLRGYDFNGCWWRAWNRGGGGSHGIDPTTRAISAGDNVMVVGDSRIRHISRNGPHFRHLPGLQGGCARSYRGVEV